MNRNNKIEKNIIIIVEGNDDLRLIEDLLKGINNSEKIQCINARGKDKIPMILNNIKYDSRVNFLNKLAIMIDADYNPTQARKNVEKYIQKAKLPDSIKCSFLIIPQSGKGMLEDVCMDSVTDSPQMDCVKSFLDCLKTYVKELPQNPSKSKFLAYMASCPKATNGTIEAALQNNYFDLTHAAFNSIRTFLQELIS